MSDTPRTQREFLDAVVDELNLDTADTFTKVLANAFALADQRDMLKRENAALRQQFAEAQRDAVDGWETAVDWAAYASEYFQKKWRLDDDRQRLWEARAKLAAIEAEAAKERK